MNTATRACLLVFALCISSVLYAQSRREPHIGYLFPAGGQQGTTVEIVVGGQYLRGAGDVHVSGEGVSASVVKVYRPFRAVSREQREVLVKRLVELKEKRVAELPKGVRMPPLPGEYLRRARARKGKKDAPKQKTEDGKPAEMPDHPLLRNLEDKSLRELAHIATELLDYRTRRKRQPNAQIAEMVLVKVEIGSDASPGHREIRLGSRLGITNPMSFHVGALPETFEKEVNDPGKLAFLPKEPPLGTPVLINGQILPGDVDRFRFKAKRGQRLVVDVYARRLVPFLADAVPGWFQATVALYDAQGREVAFADDYQFHPDPVLLHEVAEDGVYELEIRDSIYRGREDFVYRIALGELPFVTKVFPLGGRAGEPTAASIEGWNLSAEQLQFDTTPGGKRVRKVALDEGLCPTNELTYAVDTLPESMEEEPNNDAGQARKIAQPRIVNGRIGRPGDVDVFSFEGRAGEEMVAEVVGRRLHSPIDSLLRLTDASGRVLAWNDDITVRNAGFLHPDMGLLTHHADSWLKARLPEDGTYYVHVLDSQNHGGDAYAYRLRLSAPRPDFELRMAPCSLTMRSGSIVPVTVYALRRDGFQGEIEVTLKDAPKGFLLTGKGIPAGRDSVRMTLTAPMKKLDEPVRLQLEGRAWIGDEQVIRPVTPCEDAMQAFLFRHLAPSEEMLAAVTKGWGRGHQITLAQEAPIRLPAGGTADVLFRRVWRARSAKVDLELKDPPAGVTLQNVKFVRQGLAFQLKADGEAAKVGFADNAIVEVFIEREIRKRGKEGKKGPAEKRRYAIGVLPAVPFVVVEP